MQLRMLARLPLLLGSIAAFAACEAPTSATAGDTWASPPAYVTVPAEGSSSTLDFGTWNIEWFGSTSNGPTDETLQLQNVRDVIAGTDLDIWGVQEVVDTTHFRKLVNALPGYGSLIASDATVTDGPAYYSQFSGTEQKVGIIYKTANATVQSARVILTAYDYEFAGRPPLEIKLSTTLNGTTESLVLIVLHATAGSTTDDRDRRLAASNALKSYLDSTYPTQKVLVIGDFNDDVDVSITQGTTSPYKNFVDDAARYVFPTKALSDAGFRSTVGYSDMVDHHLATNEKHSAYVAGSAEVLRPDQYIASYGTTTSDHYPVMTRYTLGGGSANAAPVANFTYSCTGLSCSFTDASSDSDGTIASRSWNFGDGTSSTATNPVHDYAASGTYTVTLTVTDNGGATASKSASVTVTAPASAITLSARGYKVKGSPTVDLTWSGATGANVDILRNGALLVTTANDGAHTDRVGKTGTFRYRVCEAGTTICSNEVSVTF